MNNMKYIMYHNGMYTAPVIFSNSEDHADFARKMGIEWHDIMSAGFVRLDFDGVVAYGNSHSLGIGCGETDTERLNHMLGNEDF